ncbi:MAG: HD-GYP domain-containing protein [Firmicutes bacterium]|nr:HD-GYP domain-containing protein [Bacillota bacterium]
MSEELRKVKKFVAIMAVLATCILIYLYLNYNIPDISLFLFFCILSIITESLLIPLANGMAVSVGFAMCFAAIIVSGPLTGAIASALGFLLRVPNIKGRGYIHLFNLPAFKTIFNVSQGLIVTGISGIIYVETGGIIKQGDFIYNSILSLILALLTYVILNTTIVVKFISIINNQNFTRMWFYNIKGTIVNSITVCVLGVIIAIAYIGYGPGAVLLFFGPLLLARYSFKLYMDTKHVYMETIHALTKTMEAKDAYTSGHSSRVEKYAVKLAKALNLSDKKIENIKTASLLHDIGKIGVDDVILKKPDKLTEKEYDQIKKHPVIGAEIIDDVDFLKGVSKIVKYHHERYDGSGYPDGLKENNIPFEAAIVSVADAFDAMTSDRPYRNGLSKEKALDIINENAGTQFHPKLAKEFINLMVKEEEKEMQENVS